AIVNSANAQNKTKPQHTSVVGDSAAFRDSLVGVWLKNIYSQGVSVENDSLIVTPETQLLVSDEQFRKIAYPATYTWEPVVAFIKNQQLKIAFWYMINLYTTDEKSKQSVIKSLLMYDKLFKMDKVLTNTFYT